MRSSSGMHFIALDHVRALAAFMVVEYHFIHGVNGYPVPFNYVPALFPFSMPGEGNYSYVEWVAMDAILPTLPNGG
jgi:peptidoglycan/LPS O-acetylase OafA/YrhL